MQHLPQLLLLLAIVTLASKGAGHLSARFGQPAVFGEILAGLMLGPSLVDLLGWPLFAAGASGHGEPALGAILHDLSEVGVVLLMFVAGLETDLAEMRRVGKVAFWAALGGVLLPLGGGAATARLFGHGWGVGFFIGAVLTATSVSISAQTLMELGRLRSREGSTILGAAVIDDVMGIVVLSIVVAFVAGGEGGAAGAAEAGAAAAGAGGAAAILGVAARLALFFALAWLLGRAFLEKAGAWLGRLRVSEPALAFAVAVAFLYAWAAETLGGVAAITGSYIAGVLFAGTSLRQAIGKGIHPLTYSFFVPVFFISIGLRADVRQLGGAAGFTVAVVLVAVLSKALGCGLFAWFSGFAPREAARVGVGMISRGEVGLIVAGYGLSRGLIANDVFSAMILMVLVTTMITPVWLRAMFPRTPEEGPPQRTEG